MISARQGREGQYSLSESEFQFICELVYNSTGIVLDGRKREMLYRRLMRRTRELGLASFSEYCELLKQKDNDELPNFTNAITTNLTSFFRESHHFDYLTNEFIPELMNCNRRAEDAGRRLRIWSSASSTGEEAYSIAMTVMNAMGSSITDWDVRILATDLDSDVVEVGRGGVYKLERVRDLDIDLKRSWMTKGRGDNGGLVKMSQELMDLIVFKQLNLLHKWPISGPFDVIFCRNVLIYFDRETQEKLIPRFYDLLRPGGLLFLGHSESILKDNKNFESLGKTIYRKLEA